MQAPSGSVDNSSTNPSLKDGLTSPPATMLLIRSSKILADFSSPRTSSSKLRVDGPPLVSLWASLVSVPPPFLWADQVWLLTSAAVSSELWNGPWLADQLGLEASLATKWVTTPLEMPRRSTTTGWHTRSSSHRTGLLPAPRLVTHPCTTDHHSVKGQELHG